MSKRTEFSISLKLLTEQFKNGLGKVQTQLNNFKKTLIAAFASLGAIDIGKQLVRAGAEFEDAMARVNAVSKASTTELKAMREEAMKLGRDTKYTATEAANALEQLVRNGLKPLAAQKALSGTLQLAQSQAISLQEAADIATTAMNGFGKSADDLGRINDVLASTASHSATNVLELFEALKVAAPVATAAGVSMEETMAVLGQLANKGFRGSEAGTGLKQIILALASQTPEAEKVAKKYGFSVDEMTLKTKGLIETLRILSKSGLGNSMADLGEFFNKLGAPKGAAILSDVDGLDEMYSLVYNSQGEAARMFEEGLGAWEKAYKTLISVWENTQIKVFDGGKKLFTEPLNILAEFIRRIQDIPTVATAAFGLLSTKIGTIFSKTRKELDDIAEKQFGEKLLKNQNAFQNASIAHAATSAASGIQLNPNIKDGYIQLQRELQGLTTKFDMSTKYGIVLKKALNDLNVIVNATRTDTKKYQKALGDLTLQMQALSNKAKHTNIDVIANNMKNLQRTSTTVGGTIQGVFAKIGTGLKSFGTSVLNLFGGWIGVIMTLATTIGTYLVSAWRKSTQAMRDAKQAIGEAAEANRKLDSEFIALVNILRETERSSNSWKLAMEKLKREYPELIEQLKLEEMSVNTSAEAYKKLKQRIDDVIASQKQYNIEKGKQKAIETLEKDFEESTLFSNLGEKYGESYGKQVGSEYAGKIKGEEIKSELLRILKETPSEERQQKLTDYLTKLNNELKTYSKGVSSKQAENLIKDFDKRYNQIDKINELFPSNTNEDKKPSTEENITEYLRKQEKEYNKQREAIEAEGQAKGWSREEINAQYVQLAKTFTDKIYKDLKDLEYTDIKGDKQSSFEFASKDKFWQELLQNTKLKTTPSPTTSENSIDNAKEQYKSRVDYLNRQLEGGLIDQYEYNKKLLSALQMLISAYETNGVVNEDLIKQEKSLIDTLAEQEKQSEKAKEDARQSKAFEKKSDRLSKDYTNIIEGRGSEKINKWDYFDFDSADEGKQKEDEIRLDYLKEQINELRQLRSSISDEEIEKAKSLNDAASQELLGWVDNLDNGILKLSEHITNLEDSFKLAKAREEIKKLRKEIGEQTYESVKETFGAISSLGDIIGSFADFDEMNGWEQFQLITDSIFSTIDTIKSLIDSWTLLNEMLDLFGAKRTALEAIETGAAAKNIAAVQAEAAAVTAAEAEKTAAVTTAQATQTTANLTAKALQIKAAQIAMAAESTAAYAAIPFAGVGLAAAQIAEMQALITAAAALPAFANGGIVRWY